MTQGNFKQTADKFHIIGHSLGAHAAGDIGSRVAGLARITGKPAFIMLAEVTALYAAPQGELSFYTILSVLVHV